MTITTLMIPVSKKIHRKAKIGGILSHRKPTLNEGRGFHNLTKIKYYIDELNGNFYNSSSEMEN
jgi:hypothetical protein